MWIHTESGNIINSSNVKSINVVQLYPYYYVGAVLVGETDDDFIALSSHSSQEAAGDELDELFERLKEQDK